MGFSFIASAKGEAPGSGTTLDCSSSLNVQAGDVLVAWVVYEGADTTVAVAKNSGSPANAFTFDPADEVRDAGPSTGGALGYLTVAGADATATFRATWTAARSFRQIFVMQFRPAGGRIAREAGANGTGTGTAASSGNLSTSGDDEIVVAGSVLFNAGSTTSEQINSVAADGVLRATSGACASIWYRILTAPMTGPATCTMPAIDVWACAAIGIKSILDATGPAPVSWFDPGMVL